MKNYKCEEDWFEVVLGQYFTVPQNVWKCHNVTHSHTEHSRIEKIPKKNFPKKILFRPIPKIQKLSKIGKCLLI
jgi:hypothetical protein